jgi:hypothetical protein
MAAAAERTKDTFVAYPEPTATRLSRWQIRVASTSSRNSVHPRRSETFLAAGWESDGAAEGENSQVSHVKSIMLLLLVLGL